MATKDGDFARNIVAHDLFIKAVEADRGGLVLVANVLVANVLANGAGEVEMLRHMKIVHMKIEKQVCLEMATLMDKE